MREDRFAKCDEWTSRSLSCDARAVTRGDIMANAESGETVYPRYVSRADGAYVWDVDGSRYVDYQLGYGPVILGHADPRVTEAVVEELSRGVCVAPMWSPRQVELTELLTSTIPGGELAYLLKTGSEANTTAVRLARIYTGRDKIVRWGYNGWHDWAAGKPAGIPAATRADTLLFDINDPASLRAVFERFPTQIACTLMMPFEFDTVPDGLLRELRAITHEYGALFILDEMRSGFRMSLGGAQQYFGVQADLAAFSKAMANGYPISAVVGRADIMECLGRTRISSTFYANPAEMVAALATIAILRDTDALDRVWTAGTTLSVGLGELVAEFAAPAAVVGYPPMPFLRFRDGAGPDEMKRRFFTETTRRGVLFHPDHQWFVSAAHTPADIEFTLDVCREAFQAVAVAATSVRS